MKKQQLKKKPVKSTSLTRTRQQRKPTKKPTTQALATIKKENHLSLTNPRDVMAFGQVLKTYIAKNNLSVEIQGNQYAMVDGWKFAGLSFGLTAIPSKPVAKQEQGEYITVMYTIGTFLNRKTQQEYKKEYIAFAGFTRDKEVIETMRQRIKPTKELTHPYFIYECECKIVRLSDGVAVGYGLGMCSNMESAKVEFQEYAVASMAQTRTIGKAYRNLLGFIMKGAGIEGTPAEEMPGDEDPIVRQPKQEKTSAPVAVKPGINEKQLDKLIVRINQGEDLLAMAKEQFSLNEQQLAALNAADERRLKKINK